MPTRSSIPEPKVRRGRPDRVSQRNDRVAVEYVSTRKSYAASRPSRIPTHVAARPKNEGDDGSSTRARMEDNPSRVATKKGENFVRVRPSNGSTEGPSRVAKCDDDATPIRASLADFSHVAEAARSDDDRPIRTPSTVAHADSMDFSTEAEGEDAKCDGDDATPIRASLADFSHVTPARSDDDRPPSSVAHAGIFETLRVTPTEAAHSEGEDDDIRDEGSGCDAMHPDSKPEEDDIAGGTAAGRVFSKDFSANEPQGDGDEPSDDVPKKSVAASTESAIEAGPGLARAISREGSDRSYPSPHASARDFKPPSSNDSMYFFEHSLESGSVSGDAKSEGFPLDFIRDAPSSTVGGRPDGEEDDTVYSAEHPTTTTTTADDPGALEAGALESCSDCPSSEGAIVDLASKDAPMRKHGARFAVRVSAIIAVIVVIVASGLRWGA